MFIELYVIFGARIIINGEPILRKRRKLCSFGAVKTCKKQLGFIVLKLNISLFFALADRNVAVIESDFKLLCLSDSVYFKNDTAVAKAYCFCLDGKESFYKSRIIKNADIVALVNLGYPCNLAEIVSKLFSERSNAEIKLFFARDFSYAHKNVEKILCFTHLNGIYRTVAVDCRIADKIAVLEKSIGC